ncbi:MAG: DUF4190 domain-containing protein [Lachnospiraceae bacterium]|nr:DUF4190 domain-containing protein [Lachnospiraceae bacterium]
MENENLQPQTAPEPVINQSNPNPALTPKKAPKHQGLAIASLVLGGISLLCCFAYGLSIIPALIGAIFGLIALIGGEGRSRVMGGVGLGISVIGLLLGIIMLVAMISIINWDNFTIENLMTVQDVNPNSEYEIEQWIQQFFKVDIS